MMLGRILKTLLIILILVVLGGLAYWLCFIKGWPWWVAVVLVAGVVGFWIGFLFLKKHLQRSRERKFVQRVIDQDTAAIAKVPISERHQLLELQEHWRESIQRLQRSQLRKRGNPLYVLPWYLVLGESGAGKTSAIRNSRLSSPMTEVSRASGISGTRNCDWWFFEQAIILDTAGRYTIPAEEVQDLEEWKRFLTLLSKYRKKEPLNGVVVAVAADRLLTADGKELQEDGHMVRQRIDQTMRVVGAKFPVYLLVTKMDLVHGFTEFSRHLSPDSISQAMGHNNTKKKIYWGDVLEEAMAGVGERLRKLRFSLVHEAGSKAPSAILLPQEFERLKPGLEGFLKAVFEENPYQETPLLRGVYFSSARRNGAPSSPFLERMGLQTGKEDSVDSEQGFFLGDFFGKVLPNDRNLYSPIREFVLWRRLTRSLGALSWLLIGLAACGFLTFAFYQNAITIQDFKEDFFYPPRLTNDRAADLMTLDKMRIEILDMERRNRSWLLPRFGLEHSRMAVKELKKHFSRLFREGYLRPIDERLSQHIGEVNQNTPEEEFVDYVGYVVARITILKELLAGKKLTMASEFKKITASLMQTQSPELALAPQIADRFGNVYYAYLQWGAGRRDAEERLAHLRVALVELLNRKGSDLKWLVRKWVPGVPDLHLNDFWGVSEIGDYKGKVVLSGAYTEGGRRHIEAFIALIEAALSDEKAKSAFEKRKVEFWTWYVKQFYQVWLSFMEGFHEGLNRLDTLAGWQRMASLMTTRKNPYYNLLDRVAKEITSLPPGSETPPWAEMVTRIREVRELSRMEQEKEKGSSITAKLKAKEEELKEKVVQKMEKERAEDMDLKMLQAKAWNEYMDTMAKINVGISSRKECYDMYSGSFFFMTQNPETDQGPFSKAYSSYYKLKGLLNGKRDFPAIWDLIFGPLDFIMAYASDETSCFLQTQWDEQVRGVLQGADPDKVSRVLFNKTDGAVWKFLESTAKPFIGRNESGYYARQDFRKHTIPFKPEFFQFLDRGAEGVINYEPSYSVSLETLPLDVNDDAKVEPFSCVLEVNCSDGKRTLENYNFPNSATIAWDPDKCGDVVLTLSFPQVTLRKVYKGRMGFPQFLKDFRDGRRTFSADDFPENKGDLKSMGVTAIEVAYRIKGAEPVSRLLSRVPTQVPATIVTCWSKGKE